MSFFALHSNVISFVCLCVNEWVCLGECLWHTPGQHHFFTLLGVQRLLSAPVVGVLFVIVVVSLFIHFYTFRR